MIVSWVICVILTVAGAFPDDPKAWGYNARTDIKTDVLYESKWFRFPYPGKCGECVVNMRVSVIVEFVWVLPHCNLTFINYPFCCHTRIYY